MNSRDGGILTQHSGATLMVRSGFVYGLLCATICLLSTPAGSREFRVAAAPQQKQGVDTSDKEKLSPEEKMQRRHPQPVLVRDLVDLPVLDSRDSTVGFVQEIVRGADGKIKLVVLYRSWLGWIPNGKLDWGRRPVAIPVEKVAMLGKQVAALDMSREDLDKAPDFSAANMVQVSPSETIQIGITRR